jgi:hypothetical protein
MLFDFPLESVIYDWEAYATLRAGQWLWMIHISRNIIPKIDNITLMIGQLPCYDPIWAFPRRR